MTAIAEPTQTPDSSQRMLTAADVAALPSQLPSGPVDYELVRGRLVMMSPTGDAHGAVQSGLAFALMTFGDRRGHGITRTETGVVLSRNPDTLYGPDVMFLCQQSVPPRLTAEGYWETIPTLVAEVRSKNDTRPEVERKVEHYLAAGVELVWIADPNRKVVAVHRRGEAAVELSVSDTLTAVGIIPEFRLPLAELFA